MRWNAVTGRWEVDGPVRPLTGAPIDTAPDNVRPEDLIVGGPQRPYAGAVPISGRAVPAGPAAPTPPGHGDAGMTPIPGADEPLTDEQNARLASNARAMGLDQPPGLSSVPDIAREA